MPGQVLGLGCQTLGSVLGPRSHDVSTAPDTQHPWGLLFAVWPRVGAHGSRADARLCGRLGWQAAWGPDGKPW